jgi:hypothetical protein
VNHIATSRWLCQATLLVLALVFAPKVNATSIDYSLVVTNFSGDIGPSGSIGATSFGGNAVLTFNFAGDTSNVVPWSVTVPNPTTNTTTTVSGFEILVGTASVQVTDGNTGALLAQGTFLPSDGIFVSVDNSNTSIGFGSFAVANQNDPSFPGNPVYPYGLDSNATGLGTYDLQSNFTEPLSEHDFVFSCIGFPQSSPTEGNCLPSVALATTAGDLYVDPSRAFHDQTGSFTAIVSTPEPSSLLLLGTGLLGLMWRQKAGFLQRSPKTGQR